MADKPTGKKPQISLSDYNKIKEKRAKGKLNLQIPWKVQILLIIPLVYLMFLICYYLFYVRFTPVR